MLVWAQKQKTYVHEARRNTKGEGGPGGKHAYMHACAHTRGVPQEGRGRTNDKEKGMQQLQPCYCSGPAKKKKYADTQAHTQRTRTHGGRHTKQRKTTTQGSQGGAMVYPPEGTAVAPARRRSRRLRPGPMPVAPPEGPCSNPPLWPGSRTGGALCTPAGTTVTPSAP